MQGWQHIQVTQEGGGLTGNYRDQDRKRRINTQMRASVGFTGKGSSLKKKKKTENRPIPPGPQFSASSKDTICILIVIYITNGIPRLSSDTGMKHEGCGKGHSD